MRVPILELPSASPAGLPTPAVAQASGDYGAREQAQAFRAVGESLGRAGSAAEAYGKAAERVAHATNQAEADAAYQRTETLELFGGKNPEKQVDEAFNEVPAAPEGSNGFQPGFTATRGKEASRQLADTLDRLDKSRQRIAETTFVNEDERQKWLERSAGMFEESRRKAVAHVAQQVGVAAQDELKGKLASTVQAIAADPYSDTKKQIQSGEESIRALQVSEEGGTAAIAAFRSDVVATRLNGFLAAGDITRARKQFEADKGFLPADQALRFKTVLDQGHADVAGEHAAAVAIAAGVNPKTGWLDYEKGAAEIEKLPAETTEQVKIKDEARQRFEHRAAIAVRQKAVAVDTVFDSALQAYRSKGTLAAVSPADKTWLQNKDNDPKAWEDLRRIAKADADHAKGLPETPAQQRSMTAFLVDVNDHPDKYATMSAEAFNKQWRPQLSKGDGERAGAVLAGMHGKKGEAATKPEQLTPIENRLLLQVGRDNGLFDPKQNDVSKWDDGQADLYYRAQQTISEKIAAEREATGKPPPLDKVQGWVDELMLKGKDPDKTWFGLIGGGTTRLEAEVKGTKFAPSWSNAELEKAAAALKSAGARVDDSTVDTYLRRKHKLPALPTPAAAPVEASPPTPDIPDALTPGQD